MSLICVDPHPNGPRLYVCGQRVHHGTSGLCGAFFALCAHRRWTALLLLCVALHDAHDWRLWFKREVLKPLMDSDIVT